MKWNTNNQILAYEVVSFFDWLETNSLGTSSICLWFALLHTWHKAGCPGEFAVARSVLELKTGLKKDAIGEARNALQQAGRITCRKRSGRQAAMYSFVSFYQTQNICVGLTDANPPTNPSQTPPQTPHKPLTKNFVSVKQTQEPVVSVKPPQNPPQSDFVSVKPPISSSSSSKYIDTLNTTTTTNNVSDKPTQIEETNNPFRHYEQLWGLMSPLAIEEIKDFLENSIEPEVICMAMNRSFEYGAKHWNYAKSILNKCVMQKIHNIEEFLRAEAEHRLRKNKKGGAKHDGTTGGNNKPGVPDPYEGIESSDF